MLALKIIGGVVGAIGTLVVGMFVFMFVQGVGESQQFNKDCHLLSENRLTNTSSWRCNDGVTYWKRDGIIFDRIGKKGSQPKY